MLIELMLDFSVLHVFSLLREREMSNAVPQSRVLVLRSRFGQRLFPSRDDLSRKLRQLGAPFPFVVTDWEAGIEQFGIRQNYLVDQTCDRWVETFDSSSSAASSTRFSCRVSQHTFKFGRKLYEPRFFEESGQMERVVLSFSFEASEEVAHCLVVSRRECL